MGREELMVLPDHLDHKVSRAVEVSLVNLVLLDHPAPSALEECLVYPVKMETMVMTDHLDHQVFKAHQDHVDCLVCLVYQELKAIVVSLVWMDQRERWVALVLRVLLDKVVQLVLLAPWVLPDQGAKEVVKDHLVHLDFVVLMVLQVRLVHLVDLVNREHRDSQDPLVQRETKAYRDRKDQQDCRDQEVNLGNPVLRVREDQWELPVKTAWLERKALRDPREILVHQVSLVLVVLLVCQAVLVFQVVKETGDLLDKEVTRETRE